MTISERMRVRVPVESQRVQEGGETLHREQDAERADGEPREGEEDGQRADDAAHDRRRRHHIQQHRERDSHHHRPEHLRQLCRQGAFTTFTDIQAFKYPCLF